MMTKYLFAGLLTFAAALYADEPQATAKTPYEKTILALLAYGVNNNPEAFNHPDLKKIAEQYKNQNIKIKKLFMTYFGDKNERYADQMKNDATQKEVIHIFLRSIGRNPEDESIEQLIEVSPSNSVELTVKDLIKAATITPENLDLLAKGAQELSSRITAPAAIIPAATTSSAPANN